MTTTVTIPAGRDETATSQTIKALAHEIRRGIITAIANGLTTPNDVAEHLGKPLGVVAYHFRMLAGYGVISVQRTEPRRGAVQHFYEFTPAAVEAFTVARDVAAAAVRSVKRSGQQ